MTPDLNRENLTVRRKMQAAAMASALAMTVAAVSDGAERSSGEALSGDRAVELSGTIVLDPSFEAGTPNPVWDEESTNFGTPLCEEIRCGLGGGTGPRTGDWWAWFGGIAAFEEGAVSQLVTIPPEESAILTFWTQLPACSDDPIDFLRVFIDGEEVFEILGDDPSCGVSEYRPRTVDISAATGLTVELEFRSVTFGDGNTMNFFVEDVEIAVGDRVVPALEISGVCPGEVTLRASEMIPNGLGRIFGALGEGEFELRPGSPCAGTRIDLESARPVFGWRADDRGEVALTRTLSEARCGLLLQLVDATTCEVSNVVRVE